MSLDSKKKISTFSIKLHIECDCLFPLKNIYYFPISVFEMCLNFKKSTNEPFFALENSKEGPIKL